MSVNKVILVGNLGKDPEARRTGGDMVIVKFPLATSHRKSGEEVTEWHNIVAFGRTAELCEQYLSKGRQVYIEGRIQYNKYEKDGQTKYFTEIVANSVQFLSGGDERRTPSDRAPSGPRSGGGGGGGGFSNSQTSDFDDGLSDNDIPF